MRRKTWLGIVLAATLATTIGCGTDAYERGNEVIDTNLNQYAELEKELIERDDALQAAFDGLNCPPLTTSERRVWQLHISGSERNEAFNLRADCTGKENALRRELQRTRRLARLFNDEEISGVREILRTRLASKEAEQIERVLDAAETAEGAWRAVVSLAMDGQTSPWREPAYYQDIFDQVERRFDAEVPQVEEIVTRLQELQAKGEAAAAGS